MATSPEPARAIPRQECPKLQDISNSETYFRAVSNVLQHLPYAAINEAARVLVRAYVDRHAVFLFGNGGSAALASHFACDLGKGTAMNGSMRFRVISLTDNVPLITAWANDSRYDDIFAEQLRNLIEAGDVVLAISGSGNSPNVINALRVAQEAGAYNIGLAGYQGGRMRTLCDICLVVPSDNMQLIEDLHLSISHCLFSIVRNQISQITMASAGTAQLADP